MTSSLGSTTVDVSTSPLPVPSTTSRICRATYAGGQDQNLQWSPMSRGQTFGLPSGVTCKPSLPADNIRSGIFILGKKQWQGNDSLYHLGRLLCQIWPRSLHVHRCLAVAAQGEKQIEARRCLPIFDSSIGTFKNANAPISSLGIAAAKSMSAPCIPSLATATEANDRDLAQARVDCK